MRSFDVTCPEMADSIANNSQRNTEGMARLLEDVARMVKIKCALD
jgi:hypothetical protein